MELRRGVPFAAKIPFFVTEKDMRQIHKAALEVIATIGLEIRNDAWCKRIEKAGGRRSGNRVTFPPAMVEEFLREWRQLFNLPPPGWREAPERASAPAVMGGSVYIWHMEHVDLEQDAIRRLTCQDLINYTQFVNNFEKENLWPSVPGAPQDVPAPLQPLAQYKIGAQYSPAGGSYVWLHPPAAAEFLFRMAEIMGQPIHDIAVFNPTPLRLGATELDVVFAFPGQFRRVSVGSCVVAGSVGPIHPKVSAALGIAENIASAMAIRILTGLPVDWGMRVDAFDLRTTSTIYGSPEMILFHRMSEQVNAYYRGSFPTTESCDLMTTAKLPGIQAAIEKAAAAGYGVACGFRHLAGLGTVYMDQVFSPEQLVIDLEIKDWAQRIARGVEECENSDKWVAIIQEGIKAGSFLTSDSTLDDYQKVYWLPRLLDYSLLAKWLESPKDTLRARAKRIAQERLTEHPYRLPEPRWSQLEEIWQEAEKKLSAD